VKVNQQTEKMASKLAYYVIITYLTRLCMMSRIRAAENALTHMAPELLVSWTLIHCHLPLPIGYFNRSVVFMYMMYAIGE
jgi:hypothetical protein